jgi:hypothetical protein
MRLKAMMLLLPVLSCNNPDATFIVNPSKIIEEMNIKESKEVTLIITSDRFFPVDMTIKVQDSTRTFEEVKSQLISSKEFSVKVKTKKLEEGLHTGEIEFILYTNKDKVDILKTLKIPFEVLVKVNQE